VDDVWEQREPSGHKLHALTDAPVPGEWIRAELAVSWNEKPARISLKLDGKEVMSQPSATDLPQGVVPAIIAGAGWSERSPALQIDVDDVLVEME